MIRLNGGRRQDVVGRHHQRHALPLSLKGQRKCTAIWSRQSRLVGAQPAGGSWMALPSISNRLETLDTQTCEGRRRSAVRVLADHVSEEFPYFWQFALNHFLRSF